MSLSCILATTRQGELAELTAGLQAADVAVTFAEDGATLLDRVKTEKPGLVVIDEGLPDENPLPLVTKVIMANALTNAAVISSQSEEDFHEESEGLGVLRALSKTPSRQDGEELAVQAKRLAGVA